MQATPDDKYRMKQLRWDLVSSRLVQQEGAVCGQVGGQLGREWTIVCFSEVEAVGITFILKQFKSSCSWLVETGVMTISKSRFDKVLTMFRFDLEADNDGVDGIFLLFSLRLRCLSTAQDRRKHLHQL